MTRWNDEMKCIKIFRLTARAVADHDSGTAASHRTRRVRSPLILLAITGRRDSPPRGGGILERRTADSIIGEAMGTVTGLPESNAGDSRPGMTVPRLIGCPRNNHTGSCPGGHRGGTIPHSVTK